MLGRLLHHVFGARLAPWIMFFADDGKILMPVDRYREISVILTALYTCLEFSLKWKKLRRGGEFQWVGYWLDMAQYKVGISENRKGWVVGSRSC